MSSNNTTTTKLPIEIRLATVNDLPFIMDSWTKAVHHQYPHQYELDFNKHFQVKIKYLIDHGVTIVANLADNREEILSYLTYTTFRNNLVIHYGYTKVDARNQGILRKLIRFSNLNHLPIVFTHAPKNENVMIAMAAKYIFDPTIIDRIREAGGI